jgi:hypothetical protein
MTGLNHCRHSAALERYYALLRDEIGKLELRLEGFVEREKLYQQKQNEENK